MKLERINIDYQFNPENIITNHEIFSRKNEQLIGDGGVKETRRKFADDGLFSKRIFGDGEASDDYSCDCGKFVGRFYNGLICDKCNSEVHYVSQSIDRCGWIDLSFNKYENGAVIETGNGFHIIKYIAYNFLEKMIGRENLKKILEPFNRINIDGDIDEEELKLIREQSPGAKYWHVGLEGFYDKYTEIINHYYEINTKKDPELLEFLKDKNDIFTDKILVLSPLLRPAQRVPEGLKLDELNILYQGILKHLSIIREPDAQLDETPLIRMASLLEIQSLFFQLSEKIVNNIKSKEGLIRNQICGTRVNFSARSVISPGDADMPMNQIALPYLTFLELYRFEIINALMRIENLSVKDAELRWYNATIEFDEKIFKIMEKMVVEEEIGVLINRNPTISLGSIIYQRIGRIKKDPLDNTMSLSNTLLSLLGGDYDGDVLNIISIKDRSTRKLLKRIFSPESFVIDPNTGEFNNALNLERDQVLGLNALIS